MNLSKIEIIIGMSKFSDLKSALSKIGVRGMTVMQVLGCGVEKGTYEFEIETNEEMELLPKQQINIVVELLVSRRRLFTPSSRRICAPR